MHNYMMPTTEQRKRTYDQRCRDASKAASGMRKL